MDLIVDVNIWGRNVGSLIWDDYKNVANFEYNEKFLNSKLDISPIVMPLKGSPGIVYQFLGNRNNTFHGLPGLIADSLPDAFGSQIISEWFTSRGLSDEKITPLDRLCYVGQRAMGALEFEPSKSIKGLDISSEIHINELMKLAEDVFNNRADFQDKLLNQDKKILDILKIGTSAGGAKPKAIIAYNNVTNEVRSGQVQAPAGFTYWLLKFDGGTYEEHSKITDNPKGIGNIEYAYYLMATDAGINMTKSRLLSENDSHHFMTKRFDRTDTGEKLHTQTLAGLAHLDRDQRHSYEQAFQIMRKLGLPYPQHEEFYRRMVFNVIARNHDDHTKNHSFIMDKKGNWSLAPAYDICYSYTPGGRWTNRHQMSINGKQDNFELKDLSLVAENMGIRNYQPIMEQVIETVARWKEYAKEAGVKDIHAKTIEENLLIFSLPHKNKSKSIQDSEDRNFKTAVEKENFLQLIQLKEKGYTPTPELIKSLEQSLPANTMIAVKKIFNLESSIPNLNEIKLAKSSNPQANRDKKNNLNI